MTKVIEFQMIDLENLHESEHNPRKHFNQEALNELAESIRTSGIMSPLIVRPDASRNGGYEIGAGHRRFRAARIAGLTVAPCIVRILADDQFLELLVIENDQREDVHPLEEAHGYFALSTRPGYDVAKIASRIGRSPAYVYDRLKLMSLTKRAQELFLLDKFTAAHAIILARLSPADQSLCIDPLRGGMFQSESYPMFIEDEKEDPIKARSVRELQAWVDEHVRFDRSRVDQMIFPETAAIIEKVQEKAEKIVPITENHYVQETARGKERTIGPRSWVRADGKEKTKTCEHSVTGVFVVGPGRGHSMKVCIDKERCSVHWGKWQKERAQRAKSGRQGASLKEVEKQKSEEERVKKQQLAREERSKRWQKAHPAIQKALIDTLLKQPVGPKSLIADFLVRRITRGNRVKDVGIDRGKNAEDLVRYLAALDLVDDLSGWRSEEEFPAIAKQFGLDVWKVVNEAVPAKTTSVKK